MKRRIGVRVQRPLSPRLADRSTHPESAVNRMSERIIYLNGVRVDEENARVSILDRGFQFGDSVYEVIRCYNGVPFLLEGHLDRLGRSLGELYIPWPQQRAEIAKLCIQAARECGPDPSILYLQVTRGVADRAYSPPSDLKPTFVLYCQPHCLRDSSAYAREYQLRYCLISAGTGATSRRRAWLQASSRKCAPGPPVPKTFVDERRSRSRRVWKREPVRR